MFALLARPCSSMRASTASAGGQLLHPSDVKSSTSANGAALDVGAPTICGAICGGSAAAGDRASVDGCVEREQAANATAQRSAHRIMDGTTPEAASK